ncbi:MAG: ogr/Delta-like zinc finger family protein [Pandoraea sp.]|nr:ogr/Delta-like zinc finger family protein [Pandoraea sp.]MDR3398718.1 ogr/Delta-like zinc finger family protein [Pandoraea sp.]
MKSKWDCPHCGHLLKIRTSRRLSPMSVEEYRQCENVFCSYTGKVLASIVTTISPSQTPNPEVFIPQSKFKPHPTSANQLDLLDDGA